MFVALSKKYISRICFNFGSLETVKTKFQTVIDQELQHENKNLQNLTIEQKYFKEKGWVIKLNNAQVSLQKQKGEYDAIVLFNVNPPQQIKVQDHDEQNDDDLQDLDDQEDQEKLRQKATYNFQPTVCIRQKQSQKWLIADFISSDVDSYLQNIQFAEDFNQVRANRASKRNYQIEKQKGPELQSLEPRVRQMVNQFILNFEIDEHFFDKTNSFCIKYEQKFYIQWLKDLKSLL